MGIGIFLAVVTGYLLGSVPFALVIGKVFYKTDIRNYGSKNLGGGNAGRVLGKKAGVAVMALDILKVTFGIFLASQFYDSELTMIAAGLAAAVGHCYPLFAKFKGGKAVAVMYGFLLGMVLVASYSPWLFFLPLISFVIILYLWKIIAVASIGSAIISMIYILFTTDSVPLLLAAIVFTVLITIRHRSNISRILNHSENKITWM